MPMAKKATMPMAKKATMPMAKKATMPMASFIGCALDLDIVYVKLSCTLIIYKTYNLHPMN